MATPPAIDVAVGRRIASARHQAGLTVRDLAAQLDWPFTTLANYESGRRPLTLARLAAIAAALRRTPASFLVESTEAAAIIEAISADEETCIQLRLVLEHLIEPLPGPPEA